MFFRKNNSDKPNFVNGITLRSVLASLVCMFFAALYTQYSAVYITEHWQIAECAIPIPAVMVVLALTLIVGAIALLFKIRILTKAELLCVMFATLMSVPMATQGFWQRFVSIITAAPRIQSFDFMDSYSEKLWPHGRNILEGSFEAYVNGKSDNAMTIVPSCGDFTNIVWETVEYEEGKSAKLPIITGTSSSNETYLTFTIPINPSDPTSPTPTQKHLISVLTYLDNIESETEVFCRTFADDNPISEKILSAAPIPKKTYIHRKGFVRIGNYGCTPAISCTSNLVLRLGLKGRGRLTLCDPKFYSVDAIESIYIGRKIIDEDAFNALPPAERPIGAIIKPSKFWSWRTISFYLKGYIPLREWVMPVTIWGTLVFITLTAFLCVNVIMRKKWAESERYPMPNARIPLTLIGLGDKTDSPFANIWRNGYAWAGLIFAVAYGFLKGCHFFNDKIPNIAINIQLNEYITNPIFGSMFSTSFTFLLTVCCIAVFFELNILMSTVVGYWICRTVYFLGHVTGTDTIGGFPWRDEQAVGAYLGYFAIVIILSSKYIWGVIKDAIKGKAKEPGDIFSSRTAVIIFVICHIAIVIWARIAGASGLSMLIFFAFLVLMGFVSAKYRAECGSPYGYFTPFNAMIFVATVGGISVFGTQCMLVALVISGFYTVTVFYLIPGMQFELMEAGRKYKIRPSHIVWTCIIGLFGGLFIGGWTFLSLGYSSGSTNLRGAWYYDSFTWIVNRFRGPLSVANDAWNNGGTMTVQTTNWARRALFSGGIIMAILTLLRQFFAGFWFHPVGFMVGLTNMNDGAPWGTLLIAWIIRYATLKIGGAKAVRNKMLPFFVGAFVGCVLAVLLMTIVNGQALKLGNPEFYHGIP